jgi:hypothetical protein
MVDAATIKEYISGTKQDPLYPNNSSIEPTWQRYAQRGADGNLEFTPERRALHQKIIDNALRFNPQTKEYHDKEPAKEPSFMVIGGGMSVGMTYMQRLMINEGFVEPKNTVVITPLSFQPLPEFAERDHYQHPEKSPLLVEEFYYVSQQIVKEAMKRGLSVVFVDQADDKQAVMNMLDMAKTQEITGGRTYDTAMIGLTMTPEAYYEASELWEKKYNRIADHRRGFGDLKEFSENWQDYNHAFDLCTLFETKFNTQQEELEYNIHNVARTTKSPDGQVEETIHDPIRYEDFKSRKFINPDSRTPAEARRDEPHYETKKVPSNTSAVEAGGEGLPEGRTALEKPRIAERFDEFAGDDFSNRFVDLVMATQEKRRQRGTIVKE